MNPALLRSISFLAQLSEEELEILSDRFVLENVPPGKKIVAEGAPIHSLYVLCEGVVHVRRFAQEREVMVARIGPGGFFGEMNLFEHGAATAMLDRAPDPWRNHACHQQPEGHSADHPCERPAGIIGDWLREDCQEIIGRSPGQDLPDAEYRDEPAEALGPPYDRPFDVRIHRGPTYRANG